ncbi:MAG: ThuA domain-containing protein [Dehalococcoidia bacterium]
MATNALLVTKGHAFDYAGFYGMCNALEGVTYTAVEQPAAQVMLRPENVAAYDAVVFYDMWAVAPGPDGKFAPPPADYEKAIEAALNSGVGMVLLNHALVQWPGWPLWREISGTSFALRESTINGVTVPGSGYRGGGGEPHRNATHFLNNVAKGHAVTEGLGDGFEVTDEIYIKTKGFESNPDIVPLMRTSYPMVQANFNPPPMAPADEKARWKHEDGSTLFVWAKRTRNSPIVAMDSGDGPAAYENPAFRRLLANAITWVASPEAKAWAKAR